MKTLQIDTFMQELSARKPAPGSASASSLAGCLGVSLAIMVVNYTIENPNYHNLLDDFLKIKNTLLEIQKEFLHLLDEDKKVYTNFININKLPENYEKRDFLLYEAKEEICLLPQKNLELAEIALKEIKNILLFGSPTLSGDVSTAAHLLSSCANGSVMQVLYTCPNKEQEEKNILLEKLQECNILVDEIDEFAFQVVA